MASNSQEVVLHTLATVPQKRINETHRFALLVIGSFACICCSFSYAFNLIAPAMQSRYDFLQRDMSTIITVGLVIQYFMIPYAFLYDFMGPIPIAILATTYFTIGSVLLAQCFAGNVEGSVVRLSVFNAFMSIGCGLFDLTVVVTLLSHFPTNRGAVTAMLKTFTGLGSAMVGAINLAFFNKHTDWYFYFLMSFTIVVGGICIAFVRLPPYHLVDYERRCKLTPEEIEEREATKAQYLRQDPPFRRFVYGFVLLIFLIVFLPTQSALVAYLKLGDSYKVGFAVVVIVVAALFCLLGAPWPAFLLPADASNSASEPAGDSRYLSNNVDGHAEEKNGYSNNSNGDDGLDVPTSASDEKPLPIVAGTVVETEVDYLAPQYQTPFLHNLLTIDLWCLWWTFFSIVGAEFVIIYNATFILAALDGKMPESSLTTLLTVLNGVGSAVGRLLMSYFEVWSQKRKVEDRIPITVALFVPTTSIIITIVLFLTLPGAALPLPYVIAALGNGFLAATLILTTRTIYAMDPAKHYNFCFLATMCATVAFNKFLYGEWYTVQAEKQNSKVCYGKECVLMPLLVLLGLSCTAFISNVIVHFRYRRYCQRVLAERAQIIQEEALGGVEPLEEEGGLASNNNNNN